MFYFPDQHQHFYKVKVTRSVEARFGRVKAGCEPMPRFNDARAKVIIAMRDAGEHVSVKFLLSKWASLISH